MVGQGFQPPKKMRLNLPKHKDKIAKRGEQFLWITSV